MEARPSPAGQRRPPVRRLVLDRRYGWVYDEWKDPSEEALAGARGMFCIVPIAKALLKIASQSISVAVHSLATNLKNPNQLSIQGLHANLSKLEDLNHHEPKPNLKLLNFQKDLMVISEVSRSSIVYGTRRMQSQQQA